jgi:hypothetical protein
MRAATRSVVLGMGVLLAAAAAFGGAGTAAPKDIGANPRKHHYYFAHRLLRQVFYEHYEQFYPRLARDAEFELTALWNHQGNELPPGERMASDGLAEVSRTTRAGKEVVIIALPEAKAMAEAGFVVLISGEGERAYLTYENTISFVKNERLAVLCGWSAEGGHLNYGLRASPDLKGLEEVLAKYFTRKPGSAPTAAIPPPARPREKR